MIGGLLWRDASRAMVLMCNPVAVMRYETGVANDPRARFLMPLF